MSNIRGLGDVERRPLISGGGGPQHFVYEHNMTKLEIGKDRDLCICNA